MTHLICLANSWKHGDRCIAGIDLNTGAWIRPVSDLEDGRIPIELQMIDGQDITPLEIIDIPLAETGPDFGFEPENRSILPGQWQRIGTVHPSQLLHYCNSCPHILHNSKKYVARSEMQALPRAQWRSLQLVHAVKLSLDSIPRREGGWSWKGTVTTATGQTLTNATITDPMLVERLRNELGFYPPTPCLVTISLSMPHTPPDWGGSPEPCWKLIAAVIELSD